MGRTHKGHYIPVLMANIGLNRKDRPKLTVFYEKQETRNISKTLVSPIALSRVRTGVKPLILIDFINDRERLLGHYKARLLDMILVVALVAGLVNQLNVFGNNSVVFDMGFELYLNT